MIMLWDVNACLTPRGVTVTGNTRQPGPKIKQKKKELYVELSLQTDRGPFVAGTDQTKLFLERFLPNQKITSSIVKNDVIPGRPDNPTSCDHDLSENAQWPKTVPTSITISRGSKFRFP
jgi:hypothetical protein